MVKNIEKWMQYARNPVLVQFERRLREFQNSPAARYTARVQKLFAKDKALLDAIAASYSMRPKIDPKIFASLMPDQKPIGMPPKPTPTTSEPYKRDGVKRKVGFLP